MKIAIVGSRRYNDPDGVRNYVRTLPPGTVVISGGAYGVDTIAADTAFECGLRVQEFPADWKKHGRSAGFIRNAEIVAAADRVVAFWDGESKGTADSIRRAREAGKEVEVVR